MSDQPHPPRRGRTLYVVSTAGIPNLGDELIAGTWLRHLATHEPDADVVLDCIDPDAVSPRLLAAHPRLRVVSTLWQLCFRHWSLGAGAADPVATAVRTPSLHPDLAAGIEVLRAADVIHVTGGGFLNRMWSPFVGLLAGVVEAATHSGATTAVSGVGLCPPDPDSADLLTGLMAQIPVVDVRDEASAKFLRGHVIYTCDDAFLDPFEWCDERSSAPEVMVSVQFSLRPASLFPPGGAGPRPTVADRWGATELLDRVAQTLVAWEADDIGIVECWPAADRFVTDLARERFPDARFYPMAELVARGVPTYPGQAWLSTRFHPHLFAGVGGAAGVAVSLEKDYYGTKHGSLVEQGSGWSQVEWPLLSGAELPVPERPTSNGYPLRRLAELRARKLQTAQAIYG